MSQGPQGQNSSFASFLSAQEWALSSTLEREARNGEKISGRLAGIHTLCGVRSVVMSHQFCFIWKFRLPIGLLSSCSISPTAGGTFQKCFTKYHDWPDATQCLYSWKAWGCLWYGDVGGGGGTDNLAVANVAMCNIRCRRGLERQIEISSAKLLNY